MKMHPNKINYIYHRTLSNIHSRLDRTYSSQNLKCVLSLHYRTAWCSQQSYQLMHHERMIQEV